MNIANENWKYVMDGILYLCAIYVLIIIIKK